MEHPDYYKLRAQLIEFLEVRAHQRPGKATDEDGAEITHSKEQQPAIAGT
jgi:hypothetical protein